MKRRNFLGLLGLVAGAVGLGIKPSKTPDPVTREIVDQYAEYLSAFDAIEVGGVPIYCDPYCPSNSVCVLPDKVDQARWYDADTPAWEEWCENHTSGERAMALCSVVAFVKEFGDLPKFGIVHPSHWAAMRQEELASSNGQRTVHFWGESLVVKLNRLAHA
ncbi:MAG TPA: twin-arginine translocation signal domain-containing protein [Chthoniobacterales bacterium]|nr:twin-arginine translocation signal domain-containing protein [Chthoniobacterales bacterium]